MATIRGLSLDRAIRDRAFRCIGIFLSYVGNDISEVFVCFLKNCYDVHADNYRRTRETVSLTIWRASSSE
jgi:hypothetical protein